MSHIRSKSVITYVITSCLLNKRVSDNYCEKGTDETKIQHDVHAQNSLLTLHCGMQPMWEDSMYVTSQNDDVDTSCGTRLGTRLFNNTWRQPYK